ncbi:helix-turn-helix domain-containing protein [Leuconostoc mesenteroides]|uniref:helix-turn-helix domain-containing protein n=1 Tax=Leuconostoc mesenteroides TaxID=1245 RepID=UPI0023608E7C|nr:helix-turn-helix transcriptional regulator [Leuconostoc mesenteroides]
MNRLKELREKQKISLAKLSKILKDDYSQNASPQTLMRYEKEENQPRTDIFESLANYFDVDPEYLVGWSDIKRKNAQ